MALPLVHYQVPDTAAGEQLVLQDGAGGQVVLQVPADDDDTAGEQTVVLQMDTGDGDASAGAAGDGGDAAQTQELVLPAGDDQHQPLVLDGAVSGEMVLQVRSGGWEG